MEVEFQEIINKKKIYKVSTISFSVINIIFMAEWKKWNNKTKFDFSTFIM